MRSLEIVTSRPKIAANVQAKGLVPSQAAQARRWAPTQERGGLASTASTGEVKSEDRCRDRQRAALVQCEPPGVPLP